MLVADGVNPTTWSARPDISARSVLVTMLGDTVAPLGGTVWLNDLITMAAPFGFNDRLVRTSMFRLVSERWVQNERIGRQSQYSLTPFARDEFSNAEARIYGRRRAAWDGSWTLVFVPPGDGDSMAELVQHLRWRGFAELSPAVHAAPAQDISATRQLVEQLSLEPQPLIASARFDAIGPLAELAPFRDSSGLADAEQVYRDFVDRYGWTQAIHDGEPADVGLGDLDAFVVRTMLVHDLRRARLRDPELPRELLPTDWPGDDATRLAAATYRAVADSSWRYVESVTGQVVDRRQALLTRRFTQI